MYDHSEAFNTENAACNESQASFRQFFLFSIFDKGTIVVPGSSLTLLKSLLLYCTLDMMTAILETSYSLITLFGAEYFPSHLYFKYPISKPSGPPNLIPSSVLVH